MYNLLIPSAILVPEALRDAGKLPAVVYPLGEGMVLDGLLASCASVPERVVIVACEGASEVKRRLDAYDTFIRIVVLDELGDLCDTIRFGLNHVDPRTPVVINFSDTVARGPICNEGAGDAFYASRERFSSEWTFFNNNGGYIEATYDRSDDANVIGGEGDAFVGVFRFENPVDLAASIDGLSESDCQGVSRFYRALASYSELHPMKPISPDSWLDIGHREGYVEAQLEVKSRQFNHIGIDRERAILRKSSEDVDKFLGEVQWYLNLPTEVSYVAPRIFGYSLDRDNPWVEMEYYPYHTLNSLWIEGNLDRATWARVFDKLAFLLSDFARYQKKDEPLKVSAALREMYLDKTVQRLEQLRGNPQFAMFFKAPAIVNGVTYPALSDVEEMLASEVPARLCAGDSEICLIHGDLCFANVMIDGSYSFIRTVDPRGKFGPYDIYGDPRYELAKLAHSVDGKYDLIIKDYFKACWNSDTASIDFAVKQPDGPDLYSIMKECLADRIGRHLPEIELIEALLFLSMVPLHPESVARQMAMLATGLQLLDRSLNVRLA